MMLTRAIWVTWETQRRNRELSASLGVPLYQYERVDGIRNPVRKYLHGIALTGGLLWRQRPRIVFCQNPSLVLALFLVVLRRLTSFRVVVDSHNAGLFPKEGTSKFLMAISRHIQRSADLTLVTNEGLRRIVDASGGRAFVLPDKIPEFPAVSLRKLAGSVNFLFICSYAEDEPYEEVFRAARDLEKGMTIYVTGNHRKRGITANSVPCNVVLLGFVPETEFVAMLSSVEATIDLTTREHCLLCGAYESLAAGKPMILSDTRALREYFEDAAVYATNVADDILRALREIASRHGEMGQAVSRVRALREREWQARRDALVEHVESWRN